ncbi:MAG: YwaF family protein [Clostridia bacterium]|nr:YwaF family protein [Clostridia bacterium]
MKEFFGWDGYTREPEGFLSWQHLLFVTSLMALMVTAAWLLGRRNCTGDDRQKNRVLTVAAIVIDSLELFKIVILCLRAADPMEWLYELPLFLCSIQLIAIPIAAFSRGRMKQAALDFVLIFGILGAVLGTYGAGNNYGSYPVLGFDNMISGITHSIAGFCSLYIAFSGMTSMKRKNIPITFAILLAFCGSAAVANSLLDYNYMFLVRGDGTPYELIYALVGGNKILYPMSVVLLFVLYILCFYGAYYLVQKRRTARQALASAGETACVAEPDCVVEGAVDH